MPVPAAIMALAGVDHQVHKDLLEVAGVHGNGEGIGHAEREGDAVLGEIAGQAAQGFADRGQHIGGGGILAAGKSQEALGNVGEAAQLRRGPW